MEVIEYGGVSVDHCGRCKGLWLDSSEWKPVMGPAAEADATTQRLGENRLPCPACATLARFGQPSPQLVPQSLLGVADITIDACPACAGAWLDGGELPRIRAQLSKRWMGGARPAPPPAAAAVSAPPGNDGRYLTAGAAMLDTLGDILLFLARPRRRRRFLGLFSREPRRDAGDALVALLGDLFKRR
jgi:Zn-finger nucleic acid-binding protein